MNHKDMIHGHLVTAPSSDPFTSKNSLDLKRFQGGPQEWAELGKGFLWEMIKWRKAPVYPFGYNRDLWMAQRRWLWISLHLLVFVYWACHKIHYPSSADISIVFLFYDVQGYSGDWHKVEENFCVLQGLIADWWKRHIMQPLVFSFSNTPTEEKLEEKGIK